MKRIYTKPILALESFQLDAAIATSCNISINHGENTCTFDDGQFFNHTNCAFDLTNQNDENDTTCYHGPIYSPGGTFISS